MPNNNVSPWMQQYRKKCRKAIDEFKHIINENRYLKNAMNQMIKEIPDKIDHKCKKKL